MTIVRRMKLAIGLAAVSAVMLAGCSSPNGSPTAAPPATGAVPWSKVGAGWMLAMWNPVTPTRPGEAPVPDHPTSDAATTTLYLVDPQGNRYPITSFGPGAEPELIDWSGDGSHALIEPQGYRSPSVLSIDLHTGAQTTIPVKGYARYTHPDGNALLVSTDNGVDKPATLTRIDLSGHEQQTYQADSSAGASHFNGHYLQSADGTQLVLGTTTIGSPGATTSGSDMVMVNSDGKVIRTLPSPMSDAECEPVRWWTPTVILAHCGNNAGKQLWEIPVDGGAATALTAVNSSQQDDPGFGGDLDDGIAFQLPSGTFLQSQGACGSIFLSRLTPDMHTTRVDIPGVSNSSELVGATGDKLVLLAKVGCGGTTSLLIFDPIANTSTVLLGPPINGGGVSSARLYPGHE
jgi:TolB protein